MRVNRRAPRGVGIAAVSVAPSISKLSNRFGVRQHSGSLPHERKVAYVLAAAGWRDQGMSVLGTLTPNRPNSRSNSKLRIHAQRVFITASMSWTVRLGGVGTKFVQGQDHFTVSY